VSAPVRATGRTLADGRGIVYFDRPGAPLREADDERPLDAFAPHHRMRHDPVLDVWVSVASHRQTRTFLPADDQCPLCPTKAGRPSEVPEASYEVVVFENRFPSFAAAEARDEQVDPSGLLVSAAAQGRCEVVCFTDDHDAGFGDLDDDRIDLVLSALTDRTRALAALPAVRQVFPFENRGEAIGVTLRHPHGQIYGYPFVTPRTARALSAAAQHRETTGRNLFDDVVAAELVDGSRVVLATDHWVAFVPFAARYPVEVHLYPRRRVPDLVALADDDAARAELPSILGDLLRRGDAFYGMPLPYIAAWHQAPVRDDDGRGDAALHLELFSVQRAPDKLKYLAGSESAMDSFIGDRAPEDVADRLRGLAPGRGTS
jgi:UDPglucose--hexose-1-phosphate uridylyltransferase